MAADLRKYQSEVQTVIPGCWLYGGNITTMAVSLTIPSGFSLMLITWSICPKTFSIRETIKPFIMICSANSERKAIKQLFFAV